MKDLMYTGYLFGRPDFMDGVASLVDVRGDLLKFNDSKTPEEADYNAILSDWLAVYDDFKKAVGKNVK